MESTIHCQANMTSHPGIFLGISICKMRILNTYFNNKNFIIIYKIIVWVEKANGLGHLGKLLHNIGHVYTIEFLIKLGIYMLQRNGA